jgi:hypothetical protein
MQLGRIWRGFALIPLIFAKLSGQPCPGEEP